MKTAVCSSASGWSSKRQVLHLIDAMSKIQYCYKLIDLHHSPHWKGWIPRCKHCGKFSLLTNLNHLTVFIIISSNSNLIYIIRKMINLLIFIFNRHFPTDRLRLICLTLWICSITLQVAYTWCICYYITFHGLVALILNNTKHNSALVFVLVLL